MKRTRVLADPEVGAAGDVPPDYGRVGFIGLGIMGLPMASRLTAAGFKLTVHSRTPARAASVLAKGALWADSPTEVAESCPIVITMLPDTPDVVSVLAGKRGLVEGANPGAIVVDMSSISPTTTIELFRSLEAKNIALVDAPVSGGEVGAVNGTLSIMVGATDAAFGRVAPILSHLGTSIVRVGGPGSGQIAKACNQLVVGATIQAVAEALALARRAGADPAAVREALLGGFASSRVLEVHGRRMLEADFAPGFRVRLHRKDARIVMQLARHVGARTPAFDVVCDAFESLMHAGRENLDHSALYTLLAE